ncbi:MAG: translation initiation factor IF-6 [Candidatus Freyarchaeota archaeon]
MRYLLPLRSRRGRLYLVIVRSDFFGDTNVGVFLLATESYAILPKGRPITNRRLVEKTLRVEIIETSIGDSFIIGVLAAGNSSGLVVPEFTTDEEIEIIKRRLDINVQRVPGKINALGNTILVNDNAALVHPELSEEAINIIKKNLDVEVYRGNIAGSPLVGSVAVATNRGILVHPLTDDETLEWLSEKFNTPARIGTVNCGSPYIKVGLVANTKGAIVGKETTGPELFQIGQALNLE